MKRTILFAFVLLTLFPCLAQQEGYNTNKTSYTTTLKHTPYTDEYKNERPSTTQQVVYTVPQPAIKFQCDIDLSGSIRGGRITYNSQTLGYASTGTIPEGGANIDIKLGLRTDNSAFIGIGVGFHTDFMQSKIKYNINSNIVSIPTQYQDFKLPIYANTRLYMPTANPSIFPFFEASVGGYVLLKDEMKFDWSQLGEASSEDVYHGDARGGLYTQLGFGSEFKRFTAAIGWRMYCTHIDGTFHYGYISIGVSI